MTVRGLALVLMIGLSACKDGGDTDVVDTDIDETDLPPDTDDTDVDPPTDADQDGYAADDDCDDNDAAVNPGAAEVCDPENVDENCNGVADDNDTGVTGLIDYYPDVDGDGYGAGDVYSRCEPPGGWVDNDDDCDDDAPTTYPGAPELCAPGDEDCDGVEGPGTDGTFADVDGDGFGDATGAPTCEGAVSNADDCDDGDAAINPDAQELACGDGVDEDCDALIDGADPSALSSVDWYVDADGDGFGDDATAYDACLPANDTDVQIGGDCDDAAAGTNPSASEVCDDLDADEDCDGLADDDDLEGAGDMHGWYADRDGDGFGAYFDVQPACEASAEFPHATPSDCNDQDAAVSPAATESICTVNIDDDCDLLVDAADPSAESIDTTYWEDADGDGYGDPATEYQACFATNASDVINGDDCDDLHAAAYPFAPELCDSIDNDCDLLVDDADPDSALNTLPWYQDDDGDGFGVPPVAYFCAPTGIYTAPQQGDCDDAAPAVNPDATELGCDSIDNDCDALVDGADPDATTSVTYYTDADGDGFGDDLTAYDSCLPANDADVELGGDCDDLAAAINPGATEVCDDQDADEDCSGLGDDTDDPSAGATAFYGDADSDGYGVGLAFYACDPIGHVAAQGGDCDDVDASVNPGAAEVCDASDADEDCDGLADDDDSDAQGVTEYSSDSDFDGHGDRDGRTYDACDPLSAGDAPADDCDDADPYTFPGADEVCDGRSNGCVDRWPPSAEDGIASIWANSTWTDVTATLTASSPAALTLTANEKLHLCGTTWDVALTVASSGVGLTCHNGAVLDGNDAWRPLNVTAGDVAVDGCTFDNGAAAEGGAVRVEGALATFVDSTLTGAATGDGGGLYALRAMIAMTNTTVQDSDATTGGGIWASTSYLLLTDSTVTRNDALTAGGGIYAFNGSTSLERTTVSSNDVGASGGGIYAFDDDLTTYGAVFDDNTAGTDGGGIALYHTNASLNDSLVVFNTAGTGGGVWLDGAGHSIYAVNTGFTDNTARTGGAVDLAFNSTLTIDASSYVLRNAGQLGTGAAITLDNSAQFISNFGDLGDLADDNTPHDIKPGNATYDYAAGDYVVCTLGTCSP